MPQMTATRRNRAAPRDGPCGPSIVSGRDSAGAASSRFDVDVMEGMKLSRADGLPDQKRVEHEFYRSWERHSSGYDARGGFLVATMTPARRTATPSTATTLPTHMPASSGAMEGTAWVNCVYV